MLIQGALAIEVNRLSESLRDAQVETIATWIFWRGTGMGAANAAATTAVAIARYHPIAIINQGTAGGHDPALAVGDIVLGASAVSIGGFKSPRRAAGTGTNVLDWLSLDVLDRPGDRADDQREGRISHLHADRALLDAARIAGREHKGSKVVDGVIGSSDVWNEELDRIAHLRRAFGTSVEEMETEPVAQIAERYGVPFLGIRIVTANVTNNGAYDVHTADTCQEFVLKVARAFRAANAK